MGKGWKGVKQKKETQLARRVKELEALLGIGEPEPMEPFIKDEQLSMATGESIWINNRYQVNIREFYLDEDGGPFSGQRVIHLSIKRCDKLAVHDWRDLQWIKNQLLGPQTEAVELYPMESRLVDGSNQYHLWAIEGVFPFGFTDRLVSEVTVCTKLPSGEVHESRQRPFAEHVRPDDLDDGAAKLAAHVRQANQRSLAQDAVGRR